MVQYAGRELTTYEAVAAAYEEARHSSVEWAGRHHSSPPAVAEFSAIAHCRAIAFLHEVLLGWNPPGSAYGPLNLYAWLPGDPL